MSILADKLRGVLFSNLRSDMPRPLRLACWELVNALDSDLDIAGYVPSSTTDDVVEAFDEVLAKGEFLSTEEDVLTIDEVPIVEEDSLDSVDVLNLELDEEIKDEIE